MAGNTKSPADPSTSFYESLINAVGAEKLASDNNAEDIIGALQDSDLTEDQLEALAGEIDNSMSKIAEPTETEMLDGEESTDEANEADVDETKTASISPESMLEKLASAMTPEGEDNGIGVTVLTKLASALIGIATENDIDLDDAENCDAFCKMAAESIISSVDDESEEEAVSEDDMEALAAEYDEAYEKLASEGYTIADYAYSKIANEEVANFVGENAEKLAAVSGLNPLIVADDLLDEIVSQIPEE